ncbi:hypothetical protein [Chitinivibrio alkaliphilus]|uniref:Uncharacterized protein n=1 Tax=Chitinivibrio alkaliphilus ACht1 TaxID=1313304 RepID=U7D7V3_9BACT|nr:hypothetical protein [Chitinivibrio alkaliphilus]ERP32018.1 hypothetical protein CALK_0999 [Chitinivibrio alkaliphilus ACht1]
MNPEDFDNTTSFPAADIKAETDGADMKVNHSYSVVTPDKEKKDFMITIRASALKGWREKLTTLRASSFPWAEILLAFSSLGVGAILSSLLSDVALSTLTGKFFFIILPPLTCGAIVAYLFVRHIETFSTKSINLLITKYFFV